MKSTAHDEFFAYRAVIGEIQDFAWQDLTDSGFADAAWAYYYFSIQFRENLLVARNLFPTDERLIELAKGECDTGNLSPWPGVAAAGERMNHDEFMRRTLKLSAISGRKRPRFEAMGEGYLTAVRATDPMVRAMSLSSYEDGGLERVFRAMLRAAPSGDPGTAAFRHFLAEHVRFDSGDDGGHGALIRHLAADDRILPLWTMFRDLLVDFVPVLSRRAQGMAA